MRNLPLIVFEGYLFCENRSDYLCNIFVRTRFSGNLQCNRFAHAVEKVAHLHPHLTATIERGLFGRLHWKFNGSAKIPIHWLQEEIDSYKPDFGSFNPEKEISFQLFVAHEPNRWDLYVIQSHSLCDGAGYFRFLHDLLIVYDQLCGSEDVQLP